MFSLPGLGAKKIKALHDSLGVSSIAQLQKACEEGRVAELAGFGETTQQKICDAIARRASHAGSFQFGQVAAEAEALRSDLAAHEAALQVEIAGSYRRRKEIVHDLDLLVATKEPEAVTKFFVSHPLVESVIAQGPTKSSVRLRSGVQCDLRVVTTAEYPFALAYFTGNKEHNIEMRSRALQRGWTLNEYRLAPVPDSEMVGSARARHRALPKKEKTGRAKFRVCGTKPICIARSISISFRRSCGKTAANSKRPNSIPCQNSSRKKICAARFIAIPSQATVTIHSKKWPKPPANSGWSISGSPITAAAPFKVTGLPRRKLLEQVAAIRKLNKTFDGFHLFAGVECDILRDGSLDFPDEVLSQLDYVVVSVHSAFNLSESEMTQRVIRALENPFVTMLAHPTGRLLLKRDPYQIDIPAVLDAAARTGTWIELNAAPKRLDLDWRWWPLAKQKGVKCVINPDAHRTERLQDLWFGIGIARKGWLTKEDVVNCLPVGKIEKALRAKSER